MRKLTVLLFLLVAVVLVACGGENTESTNAENDTSQEEQSGNNSDIEESTEETDLPAEDSEMAVNAEEIFKKSAEAMTEVTSFQVEGTVVENSMINEQNEKSETNLTMETILGESPAMYAKSNTESNTGATGEIEIYMTDKIYVKAPEEQWFAMEKGGGNEEMYNMFTTLEAKDLKEYINWGEAFDVADRGDHYLLSFAGDADMYKEIVMGAANSMSGDVWNDRYESMEIDGTYEITVEKETYRMKSYLLEYEAEMDEEMGNISTYHKGSYTLQNFNEYEEIIVPEEVIEQANSIQQN